MPSVSERATTRLQQSPVRRSRIKLGFRSWCDLRERTYMHHYTADRAPGLPQQLRQLGNVHRNAPRFIFAEQLCCRAAAGLAFIIDIAQLLTVGVTHNETGWRYFGSPGRREAASGGHRLENFENLQLV